MKNKIQDYEKQLMMSMIKVVVECAPLILAFTGIFYALI